MAAALALLTSVAYGVSNYVGPRLAQGAPLLLLLVVGQCCSLVLAGAVVLARGEPLPGTGPAVAALIAGLGNAGGLVLFYRAAASGPLSIVAPIGAMGAAVPVAYGLIEGEAITALKGLGIVLAVGGLVLVTGGRRTGASGAAAQRDRRRAVVLACAAALSFGVFLAAMGPASDGGPGWAVLLSRLSLLALLAGVVVAEDAGLRGTGTRLGVLAIPGVLLFVGTIAYAAAAREGDLSVVSVLGSLFPVVTVGLAIGLDGERLSPLQAAGVVATLTGVVALSAR